MDGISTSNSAIETVTAWLGEFGAALALGEASRIARLFASDCHWRDILALTWNLRTISGADGIANVMASALKRMSPRQLAVAVDRTPPRYVSRAGVDTIEAIFVFETSVGPCNGVVRLVFEGGKPRAWTLMTMLDEIRSHEDPANGRRWQDVDWKRNFGGENWLDRRKRA
jgi:hypothetical protein